MAANPDRISRHRHVNAACALDTIPLLAQRVTAMLAWGRPIAVAHRWLDNDRSVELKAGLTVDPEMGDRAIRLTVSDDHAHYGVHLAPGINGFGFSSYASDDNRTEEQVWARYHAGDRRNITVVKLNGGGRGDGGPGRDDQLTIRFWNEHRVGQEWTIGFDTETYFAVWQARENRGWEAGGESVALAYCKEQVVEGRFRVRCGYPIRDGVCSAAADHIAQAVAETAPAR